MCLPGRNVGLASGVMAILNDSENMLVFDKETDQWRPLRGGDIAILCRTNANCTAVADAIEKLGLRAAIPNPDLLSQPECLLAIVALRYLVDPKDTLAAALLLHLLEGEQKGGGWFDSWLRALDQKPWKNHGFIQSLDQQRKNTLFLTPYETLQLAISTLRIEDQFLSWGNRSKRHANLDMLRGMAKKYEEKCNVERSAATGAGFLTYLNDLRKDHLDIQAEGRDEHSIDILTYHRAKGLEWPVVIMTDLQFSISPTPFCVRVKALRKGFDATRPLQGRKIHFWPWPYGSQQRIPWLDAILPNLDEQKEISESLKREMARLLYVGMTRARDYLILSARANGEKSTAWLDELQDEKSDPILTLPGNPGSQHILVSGGDHPTVLSRFAADALTAEEPIEKVCGTNCRETQHRDYPPSTFKPSSSIDRSGTKFSVVSRVDLGERLILESSDEMADVGETIHKFLAADRSDFQRSKRLDIATRLLWNWKIDGLKAESLLLASDRLRCFVEQEFGRSCVWYREWPVHLKVGDQKASGWIDLLVETGSGYVIIDHKSFPGRYDHLEEKLSHYGPQLAVYKETV